ncbi:MAG: class I SAM-dependent methyltransferase [Acidobacteriota bacterium]
MLSEAQLGCQFEQLSILDWGCGKGHVSKLLGDLNPGKLVSCDVVSGKDDSSFGQETPILDRYKISVEPLVHEWKLPFADESFNLVLSFGVLEHVPDDRASVEEIVRVMKPGGLFFCFHLPTKLSWTQFAARRGGDNYHDRLYTTRTVRNLLGQNHLAILDLWYRSILPKNRIRYPAFRLFERIDQLLTEHTPLRYFATNLEFVCMKTPAR